MTKITSKSCASAIALAFLLPVSAQAQSADDSIVVTATGSDLPIIATGQAISVIDRDALRRLQSTTVADALRTLPGVSVAQSGGLGAATSVFVRGGNSSQTLVLIDGVRINDLSSPNGAFDFGALTSANVDRIELLRGSNSVVWGSQAIGGVIDIRHVGAGGPLRIDGGAEYGFADTARINGNIAGGAGILAYSLGGAFVRTDGISALANNAEQDGYRNLSLNGKLVANLASNVALDLRGYYIHGKLMSDDRFETLPLSDPRSDNKQFVAYAGVNASTFDGRMNHRLSYTRTDVTRRGTDPYTDAFTPISFNNYKADAQIDQVAYRMDWHASDLVQLIGGIEHERSAVVTNMPANAPFSPVESRQKLRSTSEYIQAVFSPTRTLNVTGGVRHDDYRLYGSATTFGGNVAWQPFGAQTTLRAAYAEGFRVPTMVDTLPPFGIANLVPETSKTYEFGVDQRLANGALILSATAFQRRSHNLIVLDSTFTPQNIGLARAKGIELGLTMRPSDRVVASIAYTLLDAKEVTSGGATFSNRQLARRPRHSGNASIDWSSKFGLGLGASVRLASDTYDSDFGTTRLDGHVVADVRVSQNIGQNLAVFGRLENLFDQRYQTAAGYNSYGRAAYGGIRWSY